MKKIFLIFAAILTVGCTSLKVVELDPKTGYFPSKKKATVVTSVKADIDARKQLALVSNSVFMEGMLKNIGYFDEVITLKELETRIVKANLTDKIPSLAGNIEISNAAKLYKDFMWFRFDTRTDGAKKYAQFILTDPKTLEDLFVTETFLDYVWAGVNDQYNWYPMMNAVLEYIRENSKTYKK